MTEETAFTILVVDDHPMFIEALQMALRPLVEKPRFLFADTLHAAERVCDQCAPELVLLDLVLPDADGLEGVSRVRAAAPGPCPVVVVSGRDDGATVSLVRALGAAGFISKARSLAAIQDDLRQVLQGQPVFPQPRQGSGNAALQSLSPAQARVLAAAASGKLNKQIAHDLGLSEPTVKSHMSAIIRKLGVTNRTQAILALQSGSGS